MAAHQPSCHEKGLVTGGGPDEELKPSAADGKRGAKAAAAEAAGLQLQIPSPSPPSPNDPETYAIATTAPIAKKAKIHHVGSAASKSEGVAAAVPQGGGGIRLPSPTDVRTNPSMMAGWGSQASKIHAGSNQRLMAAKNNGHQIKALPPTLKGIADAATVLHASRAAAAGAGKENEADGGRQTSSKNNSSAAPPLLLSFPTESVYMLACCVRTASSRSIRKLLSRTDSHASFSSSCSSEKSNDIADTSRDQDQAIIHQHQGNIRDFIHPHNPSLEWMARCEDSDAADSMGPLLFVLDGHHALNFCHFTKPKTFAIRPPSFVDGNKSASLPNSPTKPLPGGAKMKENSFTPLPVFGEKKNPRVMLEAPLTPRTKTVSSCPSTPINQKVCAANFSESREAFLRLASRFWPGPVIFHVQVRTLGGEDDDASRVSKKSCSSIASLPSIPSIGDLTGGLSLNPSNSVAGVPVLPESALVPSSWLLANQDNEENERYFVGMQCPSHPLPRKILSEIYCGPARPGRNTVSPSPSSDSLASAASTEDNAAEIKPAEPKASACKSARVRSSIAVVGCMVPKSPNAKPSSSSASGTGVTTAADAGKAMAAKMQTIQSDNEPEKGRVFVVNGEDNRESFSVPTCQQGAPPVSLVIDGDNRTIHLMHQCHNPEGKPDATARKSSVTKTSVCRALLKPASSTGQANNGKASIDRVITAVLSRWKVQENTIIIDS